MCRTLQTFLTSFYNKGFWNIKKITTHLNWRSLITQDEIVRSITDASKCVTEMTTVHADNAPVAATTAVHITWPLNISYGHRLCLIMRWSCAAEIWPNHWFVFGEYSPTLPEGRHATAWGFEAGLVFGEYGDPGYPRCARWDSCRANMAANPENLPHVRSESLWTRVRRALSCINSTPGLWVT